MEIPPYPTSRPLALTDKPLLDRLCADIQPRVSELTFAGLYLFRRAHDYQLVNREFARLLFQECKYLNREQGLGSMGLRNAKLSYHPVELVKKYLVTLIQS